jgi:branched-chain amino acid transport system permease protein
MMAAAGLVAGILVLIFRSDSMGSRRETKIPGGRWIVIVLPFVLMAIIVLLGQDWVDFGGRNQGTIRLLITMIAVGAGLYSQRAARPGKEKLIVNILLLLCIAALPFTLDQFQNSVMGLVFIFAMMGLGLNIVVGFAGLLDLGYVAFFAIGAYVYAFISAPSSSQAITNMLVSIGISPASPIMSFWMAIPFTMASSRAGRRAARHPVLRMRGDYLAIVTWALVKSSVSSCSTWIRSPTGHAACSTLHRRCSLAMRWAARGTSSSWRYRVCRHRLCVALRLSDSRLGRSWDAMREDEDVAQATGIHLVRTKLLAFSIGATFAGLAGQIFAARQVNIFPENFTLFVSIDALAMIIVGGIGSIPGVILGAVALKGLPEVLRGVDEYRIVTFAALLIIMMIVRPEGLLPSARRQHELHVTMNPKVG